MKNIWMYRAFRKKIRNGGNSYFEKLLASFASFRLNNNAIMQRNRTFKKYQTKVKFIFQQVVAYLYTSKLLLNFTSS